MKTNFPNCHFLWNMREILSKYRRIFFYSFWLMIWYIHRMSTVLNTPHPKNKGIDYVLELLFQMMSNQGQGLVDSKSRSRFSRFKESTDFWTLRYEFFQCCFNDSLVLKGEPGRTFKIITVKSHVLNCHFYWNVKEPNYLELSTFSIKREYEIYLTSSLK